MSPWKPVRERVGVSSLDIQSFAEDSGELFE